MLLRTLVTGLTTALATILLAQPAFPENPALQLERATLAPERLQVARAPWLNVVAEKRQYYVYKAYAPADLGPRLDAPIGDPAYRSLITARAMAFRSGTRPVRLAIDPTAIVDVGAESPEVANTVALVDLARSADLRAALRSELGVDETRSYVIPTLTTALAPDDAAPGSYAASDTLMVTVAAMDHSRVTLWKLENGRWVKVSDTTAAMATDRDPQTLVNKMRIRREAAYYQAYRLAIPASPTKAAPALRSVNTDAMSAILKKLAQSRTGKKTSEEQKRIEELAAAAAAARKPPPSYTAYGAMPWCRGHCSTPSCIGCCGLASSVEHTNIAMAVFACHAASDLCPWCHIGCGIMTAALYASATAADTTCFVTCGIGRETPVEQGNPQHCPVH